MPTFQESATYEEDNAANRKISDPAVSPQGQAQYGSTMSSSLPTNHDYTYEELASGFTCPTCQGSGKIPRGREDDLVALIPYNDARLKPRRTCLYVMLSIFGCAVVAGILVAFLLPRPISFSHTGKVNNLANWYNVSVPILVLTLQTEFDVYNKNFGPISTESVVLTASWNDETVGQNTTWLNSTLGGRDNLTFPANVTVTFTEKYIVAHCTSQQPSHLVYMQFVATLQYKLLSQRQQTVITFYDAVDCDVVADLVPAPG